MSGVIESSPAMVANEAPRTPGAPVKKTGLQHVEVVPDGVEVDEEELLHIRPRKLIF